MQKIFLGTTNTSKVELYQQILSHKEFDVVTLTERNVKINFEEDLFDIVNNSIKKAQSYAKKSGLPTISDDTGIFIPELGNQPGVAVRRWGGELSDNISDEDWEKYFLNKLSILDSKQPSCYKHQVISLASPNGSYVFDEIKIYGSVVERNPDQLYYKGGPFSAYFYIEKFEKVEASLTEKEMEIFNRELKQIVTNLFKSIS